MKPSKFHAGMIKALALSILGHINNNNNHAVIVKTAKMRLLANKLGIRLSDVLPTSVLYVIDKVLSAIYAKFNQSLELEHLFAIANLRIFINSRVLVEEMIMCISSLISLPKLPA